MHTTNLYPTPNNLVRLNSINELIESFPTQVIGLSDHTTSNYSSFGAIALGASIIEKHFTLDRYGGGPDDSFSLMPKELAQLCNDSKTAYSAIGKIDYGLKSTEQGNIKFRRSLYFVEDLKKGEIISKDSIRSVRPGYGLKPIFFESIINKPAKRDIEKNTPVKIEDLNL